MPKLATLFTFAATGLLATAAFVRPPVSPPPAQASQPPSIAKPSTKAASQAVATNNAPSFTVAPQVSQRALAVDVIAFAGWGNGVGELGREIPVEASPEAPMSLTVDEAGNVHVLDQVNERIAIFDGKTSKARVVSIPTRTAQDLAIDPRGGWALLDRLVDRALIFVDANGKERTRVNVVGQGVPESGEVTALFGATDGYWVEVEHKNLVRIATPSGDPDPARPMLEGRFTATGNLLRAARDPRGYAVVSAVGPSGFFARVRFDAPVQQLLDVGEDPAKTTWIAAHVGDETASYALVNQKVTLIALDGAGTEVGRVDLPASEGPEEQLRSMAITSQGVFHLHVADVGATIRRVR